MKRFAPARRTLITLSLLALCLSVNLWGPTPSAHAAQEYDACFIKLDDNGDGSMTAEEFAAFYPEADKAVFAEADKDQSGQVDHDEWEAFKVDRGYEDSHD